MPLKGNKTGLKMPNFKKKVLKLLEGLLDMTPEQFTEFIESLNNISTSIEDIEVTGNTLSATEIRDLLLTLQANNRLDASAIKNLPSSLTGIQIKDLLHGLNTEDKLDATYIKNIPVPYTATQIRNLIEGLSGSDRLNANTLLNMPIPYTASQIKILLESLLGNDRLDANAIKNLSTGSNVTASQIRDLLSTLTGTDRLDASYIKNIPTSNLNIITENKTYYADVINGNDSNDGLTLSTPKTVQGLADFISTLYIGNFTVILKINNQTSDSLGGITTTINIKTPLSAGGKLIIRGDVDNPQNVRLNLDANTRLLQVDNQKNCTVRIEGLTLQCKSGYTSGTDIRLLSILNGSTVEINKLRFGASNASINNQSQIYLQDYATLIIAGNYEIFGGGFYCHFWNRHANITWLVGGTYTVNLTNTPAYTSFNFMDLQGLYNIFHNALIWSGNATGRKYELETYSLCRNTNNNANYFPGNQNGIKDSTSTYI